MPGAETEVHGPKLTITVQLTGLDKNAAAVMAAVDRAMADAHVSLKSRIAYREEASGGDYDHVLLVTNRWVNIT